MATLHKALSLLDLFTPAQPLLGLTEVQRLSRRDKATVFRHLDALCDMGFLEQDPKTRGYRLGYALSRLAAMREATVGRADSLAPIVDDLAQRTGELVHVTRPDGNGLAQLYQADAARHAVRVTLRPGEQLPLTGTSSGRAIEGFRGDPELAHVRAQGFASACGSFEDGVSSIGVPIFDAQGAPQMACSIAFPTARGSNAHRAQCLRALARAAPELTLRAGGVVPDTIAALWRDLARDTQEV